MGRNSRKKAIAFCETTKHGGMDGNVDIPMIMRFQLAAHAVHLSRVMGKHNF